MFVSLDFCFISFDNFAEILAECRSAMRISYSLFTTYWSTVTCSIYKIIIQFVILVRYFYTKNIIFVVVVLYGACVLFILFVLRSFFIKLPCV